VAATGEVYKVPLASGQPAASTATVCVTAGAEIDCVPLGHTVWIPLGHTVCVPLGHTVCVPLGNIVCVMVMGADALDPYQLEIPWISRIRRDTDLANCTLESFFGRTAAVIPPPTAPPIRNAKPAIKSEMRDIPKSLLLMDLGGP
jgi:hypothetical protein